MSSIITVGQHTRNTDFVCDGIADEVEISAAIEIASLDGREVAATGTYPEKTKESMRKLAKRKHVKITFIQNKRV